MKTLLDDSEDFEPFCGIEHPRLHGNHCILEVSHNAKGTEHEDAAGNNWRGRPDYTDRIDRALDGYMT